MKTLFYTLTILFTVSIFTGCFKTKYVPIDQETKDYCLFDEGSYWIYQNSDTSLIDSIVVTNVEYHMRNDGMEAYRIYVSVYQNQDDMSSRVNDITSGHSFAYLAFAEFFIPNNVALYHSGQINQKLRLPSAHIVELLYEKHYDSYMAFNDVKCFKLEGIETRSYWAKHIGVISYNNEVNLIRYNVKQQNNQ